MTPKAPNPLKGYEQTLRELGYENNWKLVKNELPKVQEHRTPKSAITDEQSELYRTLLDNTKRPLSQNVDVIIPGVQDRYQLNQTRYKQFLDVLGEPCTPQAPSFLDTVTAKTESECLAEIENIEYSVNEEKRNDHILELIHTESTYVRLLQAIIELIARPLNPETLQYNGEQPIINRFKHKKLFSNMEEILENSQRFMFDLEKCIPGKSAAQQEGVCFGEVCASHVANFECYRYYVLNRTLADNVHATAYKENNAYKRFLDVCYRNQRFAQKEMGELLGEPVQRIGRYTMMLKGILKYTSPNHRDYNPLVRAYIKACGIASMADDDPTKLATTCHTIQRSVKNSPCNLTNQNRSFIAHVDVDEIHRVKGKAKRPVTMFLFADKLMIAERPNYTCKGIDLCGDNGKIQESNGPIMWNHLKRDPMLKFKGWIDIEQVQIFEGAPGSPNSFTLFAADTQKQESGHHRRDPAPTTESHEDYFRRGLRLFTGVPRDDDDDYDEQENNALARIVNFIREFHKAQALVKRYEENDRAYQRLWCESNVFSNIYDTSSYTRASYKHNIAVVYLEEGKSVNLRPLFRNTTAPWIVALVQASGRDGFRYYILSKTPLHPMRDILDSIPLAPKQVNVNGKANHSFECAFWNNVFLCERHLRASDGYIQTHREELDVRPRSRSRSRSLTRSASIPTLPGWLGGNNSQRSRSMSPSRGAVKPASSRSSPINGSNGSGKLSFGRKTSRSRSSSMTSTNSSGTLARSLTRSTSSSTSVGSGFDPHQRPYQSKDNNNKMTQRKTLPPSLCLPSEPIFPRSMVSSPQEDIDMTSNKYSDSRPSSRSSTRSSTTGFPSLTNGPFSLASHSTRSSLSLDDLEMTKHSPSPPPQRIFNPSDEVTGKIQQSWGSTIPSTATATTKKPFSRPTPFNPREDIVSTVGNHDNNESSSTNRSTLDVMEKCRMLTEQMNNLSNSVHSRAAQDPGYDIRRVNNEFEEIKMSLSHINHYRNERRASTQQQAPNNSSTSSSSPPFVAFDTESFLARKIKQVQAERDYLDRSTDNFKNRLLAEFGRQQL